MRNLILAALVAVAGAAGAQQVKTTSTPLQGTATLVKPDVQLTMTDTTPFMPDAQHQATDAGLQLVRVAMKQGTVLGITLPALSISTATPSGALLPVTVSIRACILDNSIPPRCVSPVADAQGAVRLDASGLLAHSRAGSQLVVMADPACAHGAAFGNYSGFLTIQYLNPAT